jgi:hypothetical protein
VGRAMKVQEVMLRARSEQNKSCLLSGVMSGDADQKSGNDLQGLTNQRGTPCRLSVISKPVAVPSDGGKR